MDSTDGGRTWKGSNSRVAHRHVPLTPDVKTNNVARQVFPMPDILLLGKNYVSPYIIICATKCVSFRVSRYPLRLECAQNRKRHTSQSSSQFQPTPLSTLRHLPPLQPKTQKSTLYFFSVNHANLPASAHLRLYDRTPARVSVCGYRCFPPQKGCL